MKNIIWDWSGVIKDTAPSQVWIVNRMFAKRGVKAMTLEEFRESWEQPYSLFYKKHLGEDFTDELQRLEYREALFDKDRPPSPIVPGMRELLQRCVDGGYFMGVVSSDLPETLHAEIEEWGLKDMFTDIVTDVPDKLASVGNMIERHGLRPEETYFVGDSNHEIDVAKETGIHSIATTWGFTNERKLRASRPDYIVNTVQELENLILQ